MVNKSPKTSNECIHLSYFKHCKGILLCRKCGPQPGFITITLLILYLTCVICQYISELLVYNGLKFVLYLLFKRFDSSITYESSVGKRQVWRTQMLILVSWISLFTSRFDHAFIYRVKQPFCIP